MSRKLILASAGAGKSTLIVEEALAKAKLGKKVLILTYTEKNQQELVHKFCSLNKLVPSVVTIKGWFSFLLEDLIRPYQSCIFENRIPGIHFNQTDPHKANGLTIPGRSEKIQGKYNSLYFLTKAEGYARTTYLSKLAVRIDKESGNKSVSRLCEIYSSLYIDEVQDLTGWDFDILEKISKSNIDRFVCVGDFRQTLYSTHITNKKPKLVAEKINRFAQLGFEQKQMNISHRCVQAVCDFADLVHQDEGIYNTTESITKVVSNNIADHLGIFVVRENDVEAYLEKFSPAVLRVNKSVRHDLCVARKAYNFGEAKGMGFDRVLICPTGKHEDFISGNQNVFLNDKTAKAKNSLYVAITRAKYSVAFIFDGNVGLEGVEVWGLGNFNE